MIIPHLLFREPNENLNNILRRTYNPTALKQMATDDMKMDDKQLNKELAKKMIIPQYFTDRIPEIAFNFDLDSRHINHAICKSTITPKNLELTKSYCKKVVKEMAYNHA